MHICALCYICYICQVWCSGIQGIYAQLTGGFPFAMHICALCYICYICQVWCSSIQGIYAQLTGGFPFAMHICALLLYLLYMLKFGVMQYSRHLCSIDWGGFHLPCIYVHCAISATYAKFGVMQYSRHLCSIDWGVPFAMHICALCYICYICQVWFSSIQGIYAQLTGGFHLP